MWVCREIMWGWWGQQEESHQSVVKPSNHILHLHHRLTPPVSLPFLLKRKTSISSFSYSAYSPSFCNLWNSTEACTVREAAHFPKTYSARQVVSVKDIPKRRGLRKRLQKLVDEIIRSVQHRVARYGKKVCVEARPQTHSLRVVEATSLVLVLSYRCKLTFCTDL